MKCDTIDTISKSQGMKTEALQLVSGNEDKEINIVVVVTKFLKRICSKENWK